MPTRLELQLLAESRLEDAKLLLDNGRWSAAYYLAGYSVECGLKACIAGLFKAEVFPEKSFSRECYIHEIEKLVALAQLKATRDVAADNDVFSANWSIVKDWSEESRYKLSEASAATSLYEAISDPNNGVMSWIKQHW